MQLLLDTHVWIWSQNAPAKLGARTQRALLDENNQNLISTISTLELARLASMRAISLQVPIAHWIDEALRALDAATVEVSHAIAIEAYALPGDFHKDPADRMLVSSARLGGYTLVTADERILAYRDVKTLDARG